MRAYRVESQVMKRQTPQHRAAQRLADDVYARLSKLEYAFEKDPSPENGTALRHVIREKREAIARLASLELDAEGVMPKSAPPQLRVVEAVSSEDESTGDGERLAAIS